MFPILPSPVQPLICVVQVVNRVQRQEEWALSSAIRSPSVDWSHVKPRAPYILIVGASQCRVPLLGVKRVGLRTEIAGSGARAVLEVAAEGRGEERAEDDVGAPKIFSWWGSINTPWEGTYLKAGRESQRRNTNLNVK